MDRVQRLKITKFNAFEKICTESSFDDVSNRFIIFAYVKDLEKPELPRIRKEPTRFCGTLMNRFSKFLFNRNLRTYFLI